MILYSYLLFIAFFGILISYEDLKKGIIRNIYLILALLAAFLFLIAQLLLDYSKIIYFKSFIYNLTLAAFTAFLLWLMDVWPAGDAKLFIAYSSLFPLTFFSKNISFIFLLNIFVPIFIFMFFSLIFTAKKDILVKSFKRSFSPYNLAKISIAFFGVMWIFQSIFSIISIKLNLIFSLIIFLIIFEAIERFTSSKIELVLLLLAILRLIIDFKNVFSTNFLYYFFTTMFLIVITRYFVIHLGFNTYTKRIKLCELREGMHLAEGILKTKGKFEVKRLDYENFSLLKEKNEFIHSISAGGISKKDLNYILSIKNKGKLKVDTILIYRTIPFALFLFVGFLLTFSINASVVDFVLSLPYF